MGHRGTNYLSVVIRLLEEKAQDLGLTCFFVLVVRERGLGKSLVDDGKAPTLRKKRERWGTLFLGTPIPVVFR
jgi:hypothetical protein